MPQGAQVVDHRRGPAGRYTQSPDGHVFLKTEVSQAFWCDPKDDYRFNPAKLASSATDDVGSDDALREIFWLDELFHGGIRIPNMQSHAGALTILLTGPPGTGKSTLATELCYRWCRTTSLPGRKGLRSLYVTTEAHEQWLVANARSFGWKEANERLVSFQDDSDQGDVVSVLSMKDPRRFARWIDGAHAVQPQQRHALHRIAEFLGVRAPQAQVAEDGTPNAFGLDGYDVVVLDSLNTVRSADQASMFQAFVEMQSLGNMILIIVLNTSGDAKPEFWEFVSDLVIRMDRGYRGAYMIRTLEIVKARYQPHVWGKHQFKPYPPSRVAREDETRPLEAIKQAMLMRAHPYRKEGGVFVFPSIHYVLSRHKRDAPTDQVEAVPACLPEMQALLGLGFPRNRCTAFLGERGGHKSHLAYMQLLSEIVGPPKDTRERAAGDEAATSETKDPQPTCGLILSLRDDEGVTRDTLKKILKQHWGQEGLLEKLESDGRLEIMYFPPGYITPEEFFHRTMLSIYRFKSRDPQGNVSLVFNSLDQLSSRFPLCAEEHIFVPGMVQMLSAVGVTSYFVAAQERDQPPQYYGLDSMAELMVAFGRRSFDSAEDYLYRLLSAGVIKTQVGVTLPTPYQAVTLRIVRFAGGRAAGAEGILELIDDQHPLKDVITSHGMLFVPMQA